MAEARSYDVAAPLKPLNREFWNYVCWILRIIKLSNLLTNSFLQCKNMVALQIYTRQAAVQVVT
jgi:hypothetical protein